MIAEPFAQGDSILHRLDPRLRLGFAVIFSAMAALSRQMDAQLAALGFSLLFLLAARLNPWEVGRRLALIWGFLLLLWLVLPWSYPGQPIYAVGPLTASREGVILAARITVKSHAILLAFIALVATMPFSVLGQVLHWFRLPEKLVHLLLLSYRYVFVIEGEYRRLKRAAHVRGFCPRTSLHTYKTYAYLLGMIFVRASERATRVHQAMRCRGFRGGFHCLSRFAFRERDRCWAGLMAFIVLTLGMLEWIDPSL
jgi:cobalt/nickel transport system permease protein